MANYTKSVVRGAGAIFIFSILGAGFSYLARIFLARNLTIEEFGLFFAVFSLFSFLGLFKSLGLGKSLVKYLSEFKFKGEYDRAKTVILTSGAIQMISTIALVLILLAFSGLLAQHYFKNNLASPIIIILVIWFFTSSLQGTIFQVFYGLKYFFVYSLNNFIKNFLYFLFLLLFFYFGFDVLSPAYAWLISSVLIISIFLPLLLRKFNFLKYKIIERKKITRKLILFGLPVMLTMIGGKVISYIDTLILTYFRSLSEVGIYNVVLPTSLLLLFIGNSLASVMFPVGSELWAGKKIKKLVSGLKIMLKYAFLFIVPVGLALMSFSELFLRLLFGKEYVVGALAFKILIVGVLFFMIGQVNNSVISGIGKPRKVTKIIVLAAVVNAVINILVIPFYGIEGAAVATSLSYLLVCILSIREITKTIGFKAPWAEWLKTFIGGLIFVLVIYLLRGWIALNPWIELFLILLVAGFVYLTWLFVSRIITLKEIKRIISLTLRK